MAKEQRLPLLFRVPPGSNDTEYDNWRKVMDLAHLVNHIDGQINAPQSGLAALGFKTKWNEHDTTAGYLSDKLVAGSNVTFTVAHEYGDAAMTISVHNPVTLATNSGLSLSTQVLTLGTPTTLTLATTNAVTTSTHSHALTGVEREITYADAFPANPADKEICVRTDLTGSVSGVGGGSTTFIGLTDVPASFSGAGGKYVAVNSGASALEFVTAPEPALGNPASDGYVLSSTAAGARSWVAQSGGSGYVTNLRVKMDADQNISNNTWTKIQFDTVEVDANSEWDAVNTKWVCKVAGTYLVHSIIQFAENASGGRSIMGYLNGEKCYELIGTFYAMGATLTTRPFFSHLITLAINDTIEVYGYQLSTTTLAVESDNSYFKIVRVF